MNTNIELEVEMLEEEIKRLLTQMSGELCGSDEYAKMMDQLVKLYKAKETHVSLKLKEIETDTKRIDSAATREVKETETRLKETDSIENNRIKALDYDLKRAAAAADAQVKELDVALKQRALDNPWRPSADTLAIVGANIAGIVLIIGYERANVIASKALGFVSKLR